MSRLLGVKRFIYGLVSASGWEVHRQREPLRFLSARNIRTIIDVGANEGQFARKLRRLLPEAFIYSFEPVPSAFSILQRSLSGDSRVEVFRFGLGDSDGEIDFEENDFTGSSSALKLSEEGLSAFPYTSSTRSIRIQTTTLDSWATSRRLERPILLKLDVQGFEDRVIRGGRNTIGMCDIVIAEVSFSRLYEDQPLFHEIYSAMSSLGFDFAGTLDNACNPRTGEILQADAIFTNRTSQVV